MILLRIFVNQLDKNSSKANVKALHTTSQSIGTTKKPKSPSVSDAVSMSDKICIDKKHPLYYCPQFKRYHQSSRQQYVIQNKICSCCLSYSHLNTSCNNNKNVTILFFMLETQLMARHRQQPRLPLLQPIYHH